MGEITRIKQFVICSNKTYKNKTLNIMRDCLIMWSKQRTNAIDITNKCSIRFMPKEINGIEWYMVNLTDKQVERYGLNSDNIDIEDQGEINPMLIFEKEIEQFTHSRF